MADQQPTQPQPERQPTGHRIIDEPATVEACAKDYADAAGDRAEFDRRARQARP